MRDIPSLFRCRKIRPPTLPQPPPLSSHPPPSPLLGGRGGGWRALDTRRPHTSPPSPLPRRRPQGLHPAVGVCAVSVVITSTAGRHRDDSFFQYGIAARMSPRLSCRHHLLLSYSSRCIISAPSLTSLVIFMQKLSLVELNQLSLL
jgi:hypothetical protein